MFIKQETKALGEDIIDNFDCWSQAAHWYTNGELKIWTSNGFSFIDSYPETHMFGFFEKIYIHRCIKRSKICKALFATTLIEGKQ